MHGQYRLARLLPGGRTLEEYLSRANTYSLKKRDPLYWARYKTCGLKVKILAVMMILGIIS